MLLAIGIVAVIEGVVIAWLARPRRDPLPPGEQIERLHKILYGRRR